MKTVLCFGDSNTWGAVPVTRMDESPRHPPSVRWPGVMQAALGADWQVIAEGLPGRTTVLEDPIEGEYLSGRLSLRPCLESHKPLDLVVLMLGTNDFKRRFNLVAEDVAAGVGRLLAEIRQFAALATPPPRVLLVCPPPIRVAGIFTTMFAGADERFRPLPALLQALAARQGAAYVDAGNLIRASADDGIHYDAEAHGILGRALARTAVDLLAAPAARG